MSYDITAKELNELNSKIKSLKPNDITDRIIKQAMNNGQSFYKVGFLPLLNNVNRNNIDTFGESTIEIINNVFRKITTSINLEDRNIFEIKKTLIDTKEMFENVAKKQSEITKNSV